MYLKLNNGIVDKYPYTIENLKRDNPNTSFPDKLTHDLLAEWNLFTVATGELPSYDTSTHKLVEQNPEYINNQWQKVFLIVPLTLQEISERNEIIKKEIIFKIQERLDLFAQTREYYDIVSACSYATSTHTKYGIEGRYCVSIRDQTWDAFYAIEADVLAGNRTMPQSYEQIENELPTLSWPI